MNSLVKPIVGSLDLDETVQQISRNINFFTSFGGIHHIQNQRKMMENISALLTAGGRFIAADVRKDTILSEHFDRVVAQKCITGHTAQWLDEKRLQELILGLPLVIHKTEFVPLRRNFYSEREMALFFKGLHAYDLPEQEIIDDLKTALGTAEENGMILLNWPMMFFHIQKI